MLHSVRVTPGRQVTMQSRGQNAAGLRFRNDQRSLELVVPVNLPKRLTGQHPSVKRSKRQESDIAQRVGGGVTKASGAGAFEKGDVRIKGLVRIEAKTTQAKSFRVTDEMIRKIESQALAAGELPVIEIEIGGGSQKVAILPIWAFDALLDAARR